MPEDEIAHLEDYLAKATRYFWEEFYRSRYIDACENKVLALVPPEILDGDSCSNLAANICIPEMNTNNGFVWARRPTGTIDERFIFVNCRVEDIPRISDFGLDMLDVAAIELSMEDDNYAFLDDGIPLFDVIIGDPRQNIRFGETENHLMDNAATFGGFDAQILRRKIGTQRVWRDKYSIRYDNFAVRLYPDNAYNTTLLATANYAYSPADPETWPRFIRVFPYIPQRVAVTNPIDGTHSFGIKHVKNSKFIYAPFVINTIFSREVISSMGFPTANSVGKATLGENSKNKSYDGVAKWINPPWPCNPYGEKGYFTLGFAAAVKPEYPEYGWAFLTRMNHSISLRGNPCGIGEPDCNSRLSAYCWEGLAGGDAALNGTPGATKVVAIDNYDYSGYNGW